MSKQLAEASRSWWSRSGLALALLVALFGGLVLADQVSGGPQGAKATVLVAVPPAPTQNPATGPIVNGATVTFVGTATTAAGANAAGSFVRVTVGDVTGNPGVPGYKITSATCAQTDGSTVPATATIAGSSATCPISGTSAGGTVTVTVNAVVDRDPIAFGGGGPVNGATTTVSDGTSVATGPASAGYAVFAVAFSPSTATSVRGGFGSFTFVLADQITFCSDASALGAPSVPPVLGTDVILAGAAAVPVPTVTGPTGNNNVNNRPFTVSGIADDATPGVTVTILLHVAGNAAGVACAPVTFTLRFAIPELRHSVAPDGINAVTAASGGSVMGPVGGQFGTDTQDVPNNVRGFRHSICAIEANTDRIPAAITQTVNDVTVSATQITVQLAPPPLTFNVGSLIRIDNEVMRVTAVQQGVPNGYTTLTVVRGVAPPTVSLPAPAATVATTHNALSTVSMYNVPAFFPLTSLSQVNVQSGGGYRAITDPDPTFSDAFLFQVAGTGTALGGATCFNWVSTEAGDQEISVVYQGAATGTAFTADWDSDADGNGLPVRSNRSIIKEWNVLEDSTVILTGGATATGTSAIASLAGPTVQVSVPATFDPSTSTYRIRAIGVVDIFNGSHVTRTGALYTTKTAGNPGLWGVDVAVRVTSACGAITNLANQTFTTGQLWTTQTGPLGAVGFVVNTSTNCQFNDQIVIAITGTEPGPLGSGVGRTVVQYIVINLTSVIPTKQVFLAWAGQRIILEHDWRIPAGDVDPDVDGNGEPTPEGICPFNGNSGFDAQGADDDTGSFLVEYVKGSGPGNFLNSLSARIYGADLADVIVGIEEVQADAQTPGNDPWDANRNCISRVLYESEDQGQVDIEAMVYGYSPLNPGSFFQLILALGDLRGQFLALTDNQTKVAFVIYYMKLEDVKLGLVTAVSKPFHNQKVDNLNDYSPGNPWDASKDVTTTEWNVSRDILVRGRVRGWFTTSNPSGRAAGTDSNGSGLPAGRWVMPDDWPLLAGGPKDPDDGSDARGIAENFRPEFDIMIAPNNTSGLALDTPEYAATYSVITTLISPVSFTSTTVTLRGLPPADVRSKPVADGSIIRIDNEDIVLGAGTLVTGTANCGGDFQCWRYAIVTRGAFGSVIAEHTAGAVVRVYNGRPNARVALPFEGPYSLLDITGRTGSTIVAGSGLGFSAALSNLEQNASNGVGNIAGLPTCFTPTTIVISACHEHDNVRDTVWSDGDVDMWDAPMPPSLVTVDIRGAGFMQRVYKHDVYYIGSANSAAGSAGQVYPNPYYIQDIPDSPFIPAVVAGGGYMWDSWGADGAANPLDLGNGVYRFWQPVRTPCQGSSLCIGANIFNIQDPTVTLTESVELAQIRSVYGTSLVGFVGTVLEQPMTSADVTLIVTNGTVLRIGDLVKIDQEYMSVIGINGNLITVIRNQPFGGVPPLVVPQAHAAGTAVIVVGNPVNPLTVSNTEAATIARTLVVYSDNHGEFMVTANGDFKLDYSGCATNALGGGKHCKPNDKVGTSTITAVADYPDFRGKHYPLASNTVTVNWTWGGYKDVTIEKGETDQYSYVVFHALDRDGFCANDSQNAGAFFGVSLHPVLTALDIDVAARAAQGGLIAPWVGVGAGARIETVDFLIDSGDGRILTSNAGVGGGVLLLNAGTGITGVPTFSTYANDPALSGVKEFPLSKLAKSGALDECQAWVKVSNSLLGITDVLVMAHDDEGDIGFDAIIDFTNTTTYQLTFRWSLITWAGADSISPTDALKGTGANTGGTNIFDKVTAIYGWNQAGQSWLGFFPNGVGVPGANDLTALHTGQAYWIAITGPDPVTWTVVSNVS